VEWVSGRNNVGAAGFCCPCVCLADFCCYSAWCLFQGLQGLGLCSVGAVCWSADGEEGGVVWRLVGGGWEGEVKAEGESG
jgi:hypothetical protein